MTPEIIAVFSILAVTIILFITEKLRVDVIALLVLGALTVTRLVTPEQALSGFSNPAVITVWAVFILSGGLSKTGIANLIGRQILRLSGDSETRLIAVLMIVAGIMSAFMNNIGVAALLLPVVLDIAHQTKRPPSKLLLPLVFGALLGGMSTLIGTPPNILISNALRDADLTPFGFFDYTIPGLVVLFSGVIFMLLLGRRLLPTRDPVQALAGNDLDAEAFSLQERLAELTLPADNPLTGHTLAESRIGQALGVNILAVRRNSRHQITPHPATILHGNDRLLVLGRLDRLQQLRGPGSLTIIDDHLSLTELIAGPIGIAALAVDENNPWQGQTVAQLDLRRKYDLNVLAIERNGRLRHTHLPEMRLQPGDLLLLQGADAQLETRHDLPDWQILDAAAITRHGLLDQFMKVQIPAGSPLDGKSLVESRLGDTFGLTALSLNRNGRLDVMPDPDIPLTVGDELIVAGSPQNLATVRGLQSLVVSPLPPDAHLQLESDSMALVEATLSPYTNLSGQTLRSLNFREKYGLNVLAIWRNGRAYRSNLAEMALQLGDALLLYGPHEKVKLLGQEPDFLVLRQDAQPEQRAHKAPLAAGLMLAVVVVVLLDWLPIAIAAVIGATLMVITGCLTMDDAYRFIEWKAVFLIAGMLPLGLAMEEAGAADWLAQGMIQAIGGFGPHMVLVGLFLLTMLATLFMPNPVVAVLMAPIAITAATDLGVAPYAFMMGIAFGASASFLSPVGHPANVLVMGPGGYRFTDYLKVGIPMAFILAGIVVVLLPLLWPF